MARPYLHDAREQWRDDDWSERDHERSRGTPPGGGAYGFQRGRGAEDARGPGVRGRDVASEIYGRDPSRRYGGPDPRGEGTARGYTGADYGGRHASDHDDGRGGWMRPGELHRDDWDGPPHHAAGYGYGEAPGYRPGYGWGSSSGYGDRDSWGRNRPWRGYGSADRNREGSWDAIFDGGRGDRARYSDRDGGRGFLERAGDEVASWFGDEDAQRRRAQDFRGYGPKGYTRSDDRVREDVCDRLSDDPWVDATDIEVSASDGEVTLTGEVPSREAKRAAEDCAERVSGVHHVQNNLRVRASGPNASTRSGTSPQRSTPL